MSSVDYRVNCSVEGSVQGYVKYSVDYTVDYNLKEAWKRLLLREKVSSTSLIVSVYCTLQFTPYSTVYIVFVSTVYVSVVFRYLVGCNLTSCNDPTKTTLSGQKFWWTYISDIYSPFSYNVKKSVGQKFSA